MSDILTPISPGELIDKLTILEIKSQNISDPDKRKNVLAERDALEQVVAQHIKMTEELGGLKSDLLSINKELWAIEDDIRDCERQNDFGPKFIELARAVYFTNDKRAAVKKAINLALNSRLIEEKSYQSY